MFKFSTQVSQLGLVTCLSLCVSATPSVFASAKFPDRAPRGAEVHQIPTIDGSNNNRANPLTGATHTDLRRLVAPAYADGVSEPSGSARPSARAISNIVSAQSEQIANSRNASDYLWQWGQFLDHDIDLSEGIDPPEPFNISVPAGDVHFDPAATGTVEIELNRTIYNTHSGSTLDAPRQQINEISGWIDGSVVYGSDQERADALRRLDGSGRLKLSAGRLLPFNEQELTNAGGTDPSLFLAGDVRANEQVGLTAMHTLFAREHNRYVIETAKQNRRMTGEELYQAGRRHVAALIQAISYNEFLPLLLGPSALPDYRRYRPSAARGISNVFSTASYRFGHSALSETILRLDAEGNSISEGDLGLQNAFFRPDLLVNEGGIDPILRGLAAQRCQQIDIFVVDPLRNFLFGAPGSGGFDLVSLNIQRGRDHGLPSYNHVRAALGLARHSTFEEISSDPEVQARLREAYTTTNDIDVWVGGLAEDHVPGAMVGELISAVLTEQFLALRDGDRFWYQAALPAREVREINNTSLADVIRRNTRIDSELPDNVFVVKPDRRRKSAKRRNYGH